MVILRYSVFLKCNPYNKGATIYLIRGRKGIVTTTKKRYFKKL